jgi:glycosyltransferase involved in cell wall biosynthesis
MGAPEEKTSVIKAGIDLERFNLEIDRNAERRRLQIREKDLVLLFMGWLYEFSGLRELVEELRRNPGKNENIKLLIIGKGELWDYLTNAADGDLKKRIILLDWQPYEEMPSLIAASDICVLPAHKNEIMQNIVPIKMYEYMAMSKPVLATNLKGLRMEFGEENGVLYVDRPEEALDLAMSLLREDKIAREGLKARAFVQCNDWERVRIQFENAMNELVSENRKRSQRFD